MSKILVVDDEPGVVAAFEQMLVSQGYDVVGAVSAEAALDRVRAEPPELIVMDVCMPGMSGLDAMQEIKRMHPALPVVIMTGQGTVDSAIEATKRGAFDYQLKPFEPEEMLSLIQRALEGVRLVQRQVDLNPGATPMSRDAIIGQSAGMQELYKAIGRAAPTDATVLIRGESGTGKELVARAVYQHSRRGNAPLLVVNCVAIPETLLESELFGYERGAFTGAHARRIGKFEQADGGTIFLDEIGDIPLGVQAKILRVLQERSFERIGGNETIRVDVRVLAATNRSLEQAIARGAFREDLYYRLNVVNLVLPPLRERREDIPSLVEYFMRRYAAQLTIERPLIANEALDIFKRYAWPGNVRELEHCVYRAMVFSAGHPIQPSDVARAIAPVVDDGAHTLLSVNESLRQLVARYLDANSGSGAHEQLLAVLDKLLVSEAMRRSHGNQTQAAKILGLTRPTLHAKIRRHEGAIADSGKPCQNPDDSSTF